MLDVIDDLRTEFFHYWLFADIHDFLSARKLTPHDLEGWQADDELACIRYDYRDKRGRAGDFAVRFTEGGYCSMYSTGQRLAGSGELSDRIAKACGHVYTDEIGHMRDGFIRLSQSEQTADQWNEMAGMVRRILSQRLRMRNEQFSFPVSDARLEGIDGGDIEPMAFDYTGLE